MNKLLKTGAHVVATGGSLSRVRLSSGGKRTSSLLQLACRRRSELIQSAVRVGDRFCICQAIGVLPGKWSWLRVG